jgi:hypothetical protein
MIVSHLHIRPSHSPPFILLLPLSYPYVLPPLLSSTLLTSLSALSSLSPFLSSHSPPHSSFPPSPSPLPSSLHYRAESLREDSEVKSIFGGQLRSKIVCPDCAKVTVYFEYFRSVSNNTISSFDNTLSSFDNTL